MGISDYDPMRWPNSKWRNLQVPFSCKSLRKTQNSAYHGVFDIYILLATRSNGMNMGMEKDLSV